MTFVMIKSITSVNVRGLQSNLKRKEIAAELSTLDRDIYFLQETHSVKSCEIFWHKDFKTTNARLNEINDRLASANASNPTLENEWELKRS